jgi:threonine dehydrogenase-like Zn-dependent dehydrogenase
MQALVVAKGGVDLNRSYPDPEISGDEVLVAVEFAGICATDLEILKGYMGFQGVLGHEFVGKVIRGPRELMDKRVVGTINCVCEKCDMCLSGLNNHCRKRTVIGIDGRDGVFAELVSLPHRNVQVIPDSLSSEDAVFVEPLAAALQIVKQVPIEKRYKVIVVGDGRLGLLAVQVLAMQNHSSQVTLLGKHEHKLTFCEKRGLRGVLLEDMLIKPEWDVVVDCTGSTDGFSTACRLVRPRGKLVLKSTWVATEPIDLSPLVINEITLVGSRCGPFAEAIQTLAAERVIVNGLVTSRFELSDGVKALEKAKQPDQIKVLLCNKNTAS